MSLAPKGVLGLRTLDPLLGTLWITAKICWRKKISLFQKKVGTKKYICFRGVLKPRKSQPAKEKEVKTKNTRPKAKKGKQ
jgi:hypothetical protein